MGFVDPTSGLQVGVRDVNKVGCNFFAKIEFSTWGYFVLRVEIQCCSLSLSFVRTQDSRSVILWSVSKL